MFVIQLMCPRHLATIQFALYAEDVVEFGPGYGLVANMELKKGVFEEFAERLGAGIRDHPDPVHKCWRAPYHLAA